MHLQSSYLPLGAADLHLLLGCSILGVRKQVEQAEANGSKAMEVVPGSAFLSGFYGEPLPLGTQHHILSGTAPGGPLYLRGANYGVVTVVRETNPRARACPQSSSATPSAAQPTRACSGVPPMPSSCPVGTQLSSTSLRHPIRLKTFSR